jgi:LAO/AO transport system kinase
MALSREHADLLFFRLTSGDRAALGQALTLVESTLPGHQDAVAHLLDACLSRESRPIRLAVTGLPGAGKSTLIDRLGMKWIAEGRRVAVLAIDPSSIRTGGSILGDKTRMEQLSVAPHAFVRPTPTSGMLGGIAGSTREAMLVCAAAGYDVIIIETVGIGQSETAVAELVECVLVVTLAGGGDGLQGIKRGILEVADIVAVNKADGSNTKPAETSARELRESLHLLRPGQDVPVMPVSATSGYGLDTLFRSLGDRLVGLPVQSWSTPGDMFLGAVRRALDAALASDGTLHDALARARTAADAAGTGPWEAALEFVRSLTPR